jgi:hypothetical protein
LDEALAKGLFALSYSEAKNTVGISQGMLTEGEGLVLLPYFKVACFVTKLNDISQYKNELI